MSVIPELGRLRQNHDFETRLNYIDLVFPPPPNKSKQKQTNKQLRSPDFPKTTKVRHASLGVYTVCDRPVLSDVKSEGCSSEDVLSVTS